ncbi:Nucleolar protein 16, partial [Frankliniella fusca]
MTVLPKNSLPALLPVSPSPSPSAEPAPHAASSRTLCVDERGHAPSDTPQGSAHPVGSQEGVGCTVAPVAPTVAETSLPRSKDFKQVTRRLSEEGRPRLLLEKSWALNRSHSKTITVGLRLDRNIGVCALISGSPGIGGVALTEMELAALLDSRWMGSVFAHFAHPKFPGASRVLENVEFRCTTLRDGEPSLRIARKGGERLNYILLAEISTKTLLGLADAIQCSVHTLKQYAVESEKWVLSSMNSLRVLAKEMEVLVETEKEAERVISVFGQRFSNCEILSAEQEFLLDLTFKHKEQFGNMFFDYMNAVYEESEGEEGGEEEDEEEEEEEEGEEEEGEGEE